MRLKSALRRLWLRRRNSEAPDRAKQKIIKAKLLILSRNPAVLKNNIKRLSGPEEALYRLRIGAYRVIFKKDETRLIVLVVRIGHRREIYSE